MCYDEEWTANYLTPGFNYGIYKTKRERENEICAMVKSIISDNYKTNREREDEIRAMVNSIIEEQLKVNNEIVQSAVSTIAVADPKKTTLLKVVEPNLEEPINEAQSMVPAKPIIKKGRKFKIGEHYFIYPMKNKKLRREYVVKKTVYTIRDKQVNIVIMKQVSGSNTTRFTLNKDDCLKLHLKYEEGLEVFSMELDWKLIKNKK